MRSKNCPDFDDATAWKRKTYTRWNYYRHHYHTQILAISLSKNSACGCENDSAKYSSTGESVSNEAPVLLEM